MPDSTTPQIQADPVQSAVSQDMIDACAQEQIQFLGHVQDFGCLLVITSQWVVRNASANSQAILGIAPEALVAQRLTDLVPASTMHTLRGKVQVMGRGDEGIRLFDVDVFGDGRGFDIAIHRDNQTFLLEFEPKRPDRVRDPAAVAQSLLPRMVRADTTDELCEIAADAVWALTGFDRVMVYRFEQDFSGVVVAETLNGAASSYMGHRFPASDIPAQARALYRRNLMRIIADVDAPVHPIVPPQAPSGAPTDLSLSVTRAVSPIHLQYLRNMDVGASMSVSILLEGELWGMIACHHAGAHYVDYETRSAIELFTQLLAYEIGLRAVREERRQSEAALDAHERVAMLVESSTSPTPDLAAIAREIERVFEIEGVAMLIGGHYHAAGLVPTREEFTRLMGDVARNGLSRVFSSDNLGLSSPGVVAPERGIGGMLAIPIHSQRGDGVILFRREMTRDLIWAGRPEKERLADGRLSPRTSFSTWREERRGFCQSWTRADQSAAEVMRVSLLETTLRLSSDRDRMSTSRNERQEVVIAELTHRLRNVYTTIAAAIDSGAQKGDDALRGFAAEMQDRLGAMKRASDVLTRRDQQSSSLHRLIRDEVRAYAGADDRLDYAGCDVMLTPVQRSALTLVIHELTTNAVKYGAFAAAAGRVEVTVDNTADAVEIVWRERGGPAVAAPGRVGFGSALIEQTIPHELGGTVATNFAPEGFEMRMRIPGLASAPAGQPAAERPRVTLVPQGNLRLSGRVLVVEDNTIIAMNAAQTLRRLGADDVVIAPGADAAMAALDAGDVTFAVLDQDLGGISSQAVAERLEGAGVPFVMASGLVPDPADTQGVFGRAIWIEKPYSSEAIGQALGLHFADRFAQADG